MKTYIALYRMILNRLYGTLFRPLYVGVEYLKWDILKEKNNVDRP